jgi:hypothetical protein
MGGQEEVCGGKGGRTAEQYEKKDMGGRTSMV